MIAIFRGWLIMENEANERNEMNANSHRHGRAPAILRRWNADDSITLNARGKKLMTFRGYDAVHQADAFIRGWFGEQPHRVRTIFTESKKTAI